MVLQFQLSILTNPISEVAENQTTLEQLFQPHNRHCQRESEWMEHYTRKWVLKGLLIQGMKIDLESRRLLKGYQMSNELSMLGCHCTIKL